MSGVDLIRQELGSKLFRVRLDISATTQERTIACGGYGFQLVSGFSVAYGSVPDGESVPPHCKIAPLAGDEGGYAPGVSPAAHLLAREYRTDRGEVYDGAQYACTFERLSIYLEVPSVLAANPTYVVVRVFTSARTAPQPIVTGRMPGRPVWDFFCGRPISINTTISTIYDDSNPHYLEDDELGSTGAMRWADDPAKGTGIGGDFRPGPTHSFKRRVWGCFEWTKTAAETANLYLDLPQAYPYQSADWALVASFASANIADPGGGNRAAAFLGSITAPIYVPGAIRIRGLSSSGTIVGRMHLYFMEP